jgi:hypothetical protein
MSHPKDNELIPLGTIVRIKSGIHKGKKARIDRHVFLHAGRNFIHYECSIERPSNGPYALYHGDLQLI